MTQPDSFVGWAVAQTCYARSINAEFLV
jgi:hypothetical protein